jgi:hypothetical protein
MGGFDRIALSCSLRFIRRKESATQRFSVQNFQPGRDGGFQRLENSLDAFAQVSTILIYEEAYRFDAGIPGSPYSADDAADGYRLFCHDGL